MSKIKQVGDKAYGLEITHLGRGSYLWASPFGVITRDTIEGLLSYRDEIGDAFDRPKGEYEIEERVVRVVLCPTRNPNHGPAVTEWYKSEEEE